MKIITFNVNGIRSIMTKIKDGTKSAKPVSPNVITQLLTEHQPDVLCLQEVRCSSTLDLSPLCLKDLGYHHLTINCSTSKKGYSGTATISKTPPQEVLLGFSEQQVPNSSELNTEGRMITTVFDRYIVINLYVPNSKADLKRLEFRVMEWEHHIRMHLSSIQQQHPDKTILLCGDLNVAHDPIDVHNPSSAKGSHGYTEEERHALTTLLRENSLIDTFREKHPTDKKYSWFSPFAQSRKRNKGWRIDYVLASQRVKSKIISADILHEFHGSDHVPCIAELDL